MTKRIVVWVLAAALGLAPALAHAQSAQIRATVLQYKPPTPAAGGGGINFTFTSAPAMIAGGANSFASVPIGTPAANRKVIIGTFLNSNGPITAVTANGGAINFTQAGTSGAASFEVAIWYATIASGTTLSDVTLTSTVSFPTWVGIAVAAINSSSAPGTAQAEAVAFNADPQVTAAITVPSGGVGIFMGGAGNGNIAPTSTWTIDASTTQAGAGTVQLIMGHILTSGSQTPSVSGYNSTGYGMVAVPFGP